MKKGYMRGCMTLKGYTTVPLRLINPFEGFIILRLFFTVWSLSRGRRPYFTGRHPRRHVFLLFVFMVVFYRPFLFPNSSIGSALCSTLHLRPGLAIGTRSQDEKL